MSVTAQAQAPAIQSTQWFLSSSAAAVLRSAQRDYDAGVDLSDLSRSWDDLKITDIQEKVQQLAEALDVEEMAARGALESTAGNTERAAAVLLG